MARKSNPATGKPAGKKPANGTGIPSKISDDNTDNDEQLTERYTGDDDEVAEGVRTTHPNRNIDKDDATNAGGYRG